MSERPITNQHKKSLWKKWAAILLSLILLNIGSYWVYWQWDLTTDKRFTLTDASKNLLHDLNEEIEVIVFLTGDEAPAAFKRLAKSTGELLNSLRELSDNKLTYRIVDPLGKDTTVIPLLRDYQMTGIPVTINEGKKGATQRMLFPWALVVNKANDGKALPVALQETNTPNLNRTILNRSEMLLEYNIMYAIQQVTQKQTIKIGYLIGHGEDISNHVLVAKNTLENYYQFFPVNIHEQAQLPQDLQAIIINRPLEKFNDIDKYKLDQYLIQGGNILVTMDGTTASLDSLQMRGLQNILALDLGLTDLFFHYGLRVNHNLAQDVFCEGIPLQVQQQQGAPDRFPWVYFPLMKGQNNHPINQHLDWVLGRFVSSIDTMDNENGLQKTVLLQTSNNSKLQGVPSPIILESALENIKPEEFRKNNLITSVILEGQFPSFYANKKPVALSEYLNSLGNEIEAPTMRPGKLLVVADGDFLYNEYSKRNGALDLGVYRFNPYERYDNKNFLLNSIEYLTNPNHLLEARAKNFGNRILDPKRVQAERTTWQLINIGLPILIIIILGIVFVAYRKRRFTR